MLHAQRDAWACCSLRPQDAEEGSGAAWGITILAVLVLVVPLVGAVLLQKSPTEEVSGCGIGGGGDLGGFVQHEASFRCIFMVPLFFWSPEIAKTARFLRRPKSILTRKPTRPQSLVSTVLRMPAPTKSDRRKFTLYKN